MKINQLCMKLFRMTILLSFFYLGTSMMSSNKPNSSALASIDITVLNKKTGKALVGAGIRTEDFSFSTTTNIDGKAYIMGLDNRREVIFSYKGYKTLKLPVYQIRRQKGFIMLKRNLFKN